MTDSVDEIRIHQLTEEGDDDFFGEDWREDS